MEKLLKRKDAATLLQVSEKMLTKIVRENDVPHLKVGTRVRFVKNELLECLRSQKAPE